MNEIKVKTPCGNIIGRMDKDNKYSEFMGVRFATAGRWEYPKEVTSWGEEYRAFERGASCSQLFESDKVEKRSSDLFYDREFRNGAPITYSEDCFFLNLWVPAEAHNAPVLVFIHGGGLSMGSKDELEIDGAEYAKKGVIFAAISYRVNILGFFAHPELKKRDGYTGNYGFFDQLTALQWISHNIESFGGNPKRISIMGQSAGAASVEALTVSPLAKGLIFGSIMHSGHVFIPRVKMTQTLEKGYELGEQFLKRAGASDIDELKRMPIEKIITTCYEVSKDQKLNITTPVVDGRLYNEDISQMFEHKDWKDTHIICGSLSDDPMPALFAIMSRLICRYASRRSKNPSYAFIMDREVPGSEYGSFHSADLWYSIGSMQHCWRTFEKVDYELSELWMNYYINFVKTGDPNGEGLPIWESMDSKQRRFMHFGKTYGDMKKQSVVKLLFRAITHSHLAP